MGVDIRARFKGGGSHIELPPIFSDDGNYKFVAWKNVVFCYNTKTGKRVSEFTGMKDRIIGFNYSVHNGKQFIVAAATNGYVMIWNIESSDSRFLIMNYKNIELFKLIDLESDEKYVFIKALVVYKDNKYNFCTFESKTKEMHRLISIESDVKYKCDLGGSTEKYLAIVKENQLIFVKFMGRQLIKTFSIAEDKRLTAVACHPKEECVLTGDSLGRVLVWQGLSLRKVQSVYHWHSLPVKAVCFSTSGSMFFSGGDENVLVKWDFRNPHLKQFLPRLPSSIEHISVANNNLYVAIATGDNAIQIVNSQLKLVSVIQHLVMGKKFRAGIVYDPRTKALVLNGITGHVQFYTPEDMNLLYNLDVVIQNIVTGDRDFNIENADVRRIAIDKSGLWMATVEQEKGLSFGKEIKLKFWNFNNVQQEFELNTCVDYPHEKEIKQILFQPLNKQSNLQCVSISHEGKFKIWQLMEIKTVYTESIAWKCLGVGFYKNLNPNAITFSTDGSLLSVAFGPVVTCWLPDSCELKCSLIHSNHSRDVQHLAFGTGNQCHLLVSATKEQISVWNVLTLSMVWTVSISVSFLTADPNSSNMAVITDEKKLFVFAPISHTPLYQNDTIFSKLGNIICATFVPNSLSNDLTNEWYQRSHLYVIDSNKELFCVSTEEEESQKLVLPTAFEENHNSVFSYMLPKHKSGVSLNFNPTTHLLEDRASKLQKIRDLLEAPLHTMLPIRLTCGSLLQAMVQGSTEIET